MKKRCISIGYKLLSTLKNICTLSRIKNHFKIIALGLLGFIIGKFFGLGVIISGAFVYKKAASIKTSVTHRILVTILGSLIGGVIAIIIGGISMKIAPETTTLVKFSILYAIVIVTRMIMYLVAQNKKLKQQTAKFK